MSFKVVCEDGRELARTLVPQVEIVLEILWMVCIESLAMIVEERDVVVSCHVFQHVIVVGLSMRI